MSNQNKPGRLETTGLRRHSETDITSPGTLRAPLTDGIPVSSPVSLRQESRTQEQASELQLRWNEGIAKNIGFSDGYDNVAVLIIKWHNDLDALKTQDEVRELEAVFKNDFNYKTRKIELHTKSAPQLQLNRAMAAFVEDFDGPRTLLIVYYTGHSKYRPKARGATTAEPGLLEFFAETPPRSPQATEPSEGKGNAVARAHWHQAERSLLEGLQADALAILDTCFAAQAHKSVMEGNRTYQLLAACGHDMVTSGPGKNSFTAALIKVLRDLRAENRPFSTWRLCERINMHPPRHGSPSYVYDRLQQNERYIRLSPLDSSEREKEQRSNRVANERQSASFLTLCFAFGESCKTLSEAHIDTLTKNLPQACRDAGMDLHGIELREFRQRKPSIIRKVGRALIATSRLRDLGRARSDTQHTNREALNSLDEAPRTEGRTMQSAYFQRSPSVNIRTDETKIQTQNAFLAPQYFDGDDVDEAQRQSLEFHTAPSEYSRREPGPKSVFEYVGILTTLFLGLGFLACLLTTLFLHKDALMTQWKYVVR